MTAPAVTPVITAEHLARHYEVGGSMFRKSRIVKALSEASFSIDPGKTLAVVGESGCGKSTLARLVTLIEEPTAGSFTLDGIPGTPDNWARLRESVQIVFQDPYGSLNLRHRVGSILEEPLKINRPNMSAAEREEKARAMMQLVGLRPEHYDRFPHMFSGGQRQRIAVGRALMLEPKLIVLDEPVSALDVSIQSQVLNLLLDLQERLDLAYMFISHDLSVVRHVADEVIVMYLGRPVEFASKQALFAHPRHPYSKALLSATPTTEPTRQLERIKLEGELPSPLNVPDGCPFAPRCWKAQDRCRATRPALEAAGNGSGNASPGHRVACYFPE